MRLEQVVLGLLFFLVVTGFGASLYMATLEDYGVSPDNTAFPGNITQYGALSDLAISDKDSVTTNPVSTEDSDSALQKSALPPGLGIFDYLNYAYQILFYLPEILSIPALFVKVFYAVFIVFSVTFLMYLIRGFKPQN